MKHHILIAALCVALMINAVGDWHRWNQQREMNRLVTRAISLIVERIVP